MKGWTWIALLVVQIGLSAGCSVVNVGFISEAFCEQLCQAAYGGAAVCKR